MKQLKNLIQNIEILQVEGVLEVEISGIEFDSRKVEKSSLFIAISGTQVDGHNYIDQAIKMGATVIICQDFPTSFQKGVSYLKVKNTTEVLGILAANYYDHPSKLLKLIGITGTNGKTTVATLLYRLFMDLGFKAGLLSTVEYRIGDFVLASSHTTPDAISLQKLIRDMVDSGCEYCFMEVSSHAIDQYRTQALEFKGGVFTNITHDHLDYHGTFDNYLKVKKKFFDELPETAFALVNSDDKNGIVMMQNTKAKKYKYSLRSFADFKAKILDNTIDGLLLEVNGTQMHSRLVGEFNASNLLAVYGTASLCGVDNLELLTALSNLKPAEGRFEYVREIYTRRVGIVDYAHTPDALEKIFEAIAQVKPSRARIITVVGCGGDRDKSKRPLMGKIAVKHSDIAIFTADNPRSEDADSIINEMLAGVPEGDIKKTVNITDRKQAIKTACLMSGQSDIIVVAGKGHEKYQEIKGVKYPFDDLVILQEEMNSSALKYV
ncbi:MAG TPA: UDP-N-acetylmuramoyl-L-alanyl-D-glutamate--2,6-diaminopimelate ligase [Saprospiraceae bacterium]|nr:UDP-N-acetylmuramoyl-L-alanyl-D-glutamate--2,6-diaminopimelate ligase [Saprospiraceae bacterium]